MASRIFAEPSVQRRAVTKEMEEAGWTRTGILLTYSVVLQLECRLLLRHCTAIPCRGVLCPGSERVDQDYLSNDKLADTWLSRKLQLYNNS